MQLGRMFENGNHISGKISIEQNKTYFMIGVSYLSFLTTLFSLFCVNKSQRNSLYGIFIRFLPSVLVACVQKVNVFTSSWTAGVSSTMSSPNIEQVLSGRRINIYFVDFYIRSLLNSYVFWFDEMNGTEKKRKSWERIRKLVALLPMTNDVYSP